jgi:hypothetical protein
MALYDPAPIQQLAVQRARADVVLARLATCVFAVSGGLAFHFEHSVLATCFAAVAAILFCLSIVASIKLRNLNHSGSPL